MSGGGGSGGDSGWRPTAAPIKPGGRWRRGRWARRSLQHRGDYDTQLACSGRYRKA